MNCARFNVQASMFGTDKEILLKTRRNLPVFLDTLSHNLCLVRVHAFVAREIPLLQSQNISLRFSASSVQSVQAYVDNPQEAAGPQASSSASWSFGSSVAGRTHTEESRPTLQPYPSRLELAFSSDSATVRVAISEFAFAKRPFGFGRRRTLFPLSRKRLGLVSDGREAVPSQSSRLSRSCALVRAGEPSWLVSGDRDNPYSDTQTHPGLGLRRGFGNYQAWQEPGLDRAALPFSSHQPIAELPRPTQSQLGRQTVARSALPTCPASFGAARWLQVGNRAQKTEAPCSASNRIARHAHDRSRVSQADRPFQSLSEISRPGSADYYGQRRSYEPKSS